MKTVLFSIAVMVMAGAPVMPAHAQEKSLGVFYAQSYKDLGDQNIRAQGGGVQFMVGSGLIEAGGNAANLRVWDLSLTGGIAVPLGRGFFNELQGGVGVGQEQFQQVRLMPVAALSIGKKFTLEGENSSVVVRTKFAMRPDYGLAAHWPNWTLLVSFGWQGNF